MGLSPRSVHAQVQQQPRTAHVEVNPFDYNTADHPGQRTRDEVDTATGLDDYDMQLHHVDDDDDDDVGQPQGVAAEGLGFQVGSRTRNSSLQYSKHVVSNAQGPAVSSYSKSNQQFVPAVQRITKA